MNSGGGSRDISSAKLLSPVGGDVIIKSLVSVGGDVIITSLVSMGVMS